MQAHPNEGYVFHIDCPTEIPGEADAELSGWLASRSPIRSIHLGGQALGLVERSDVANAFPAYPQVAGFAGTVAARDIIEGARLRFRIAFEDGEIFVEESFSPPPERPAFGPALALKARLAYHELLMRCSPDPQARWRRSLRCELLRFELERGPEFRCAEAQRILALFAATLPNAVVLQVGLCDGVQNDPIAEFWPSTAWRGILVEPVPHLCEALRKRYGDSPNISVVQAAVSDTEGSLPFYRPRHVEGDSPVWHQMLGSLDRNVLLKSRDLIPDIEERIVEEPVRAVRIQTLLEENGGAKPDLVIIDAEGHDYKILRQLDFAVHPPELILFEHQHLDPVEKRGAIQLIEENGYRWTALEDGNTIAWLWSR